MTLPSTTYIDVETMVAHVPEKKLRQLDKDLEKLQDYMSTKYIIGIAVHVIDNMRKLLDDTQGLEVMCSLAYIIDNHVPTMDSCAQAFIYTQIKGVNQVSLTTTIASIPTYTNPNVTTMIQQSNSIAPTLGIFTGNPYSLINSNIIFPNQSPLSNLQYSSQPNTYTLPPSSPHSQNTTRNDSVINQLL